jgi:hypothetical protein
MLIQKFWPFGTGISVIVLPSGSLSGCDKGITSSSDAILAPVGAIGCILSVSFVAESQFIIANVRDEVAIYFGHRDEQRHLLVVAERYLVGPGTREYIAFGCQNLLAESPLGLGALGQFPEGECEGARSSGV